MYSTVAVLVMASIAGWHRVGLMALGVCGLVAVLLAVGWFAERFSVKPPTEQELENATRGSDDYQRYRTEFHRAATQLILDGRCSLKDFVEMGGWVRSVHRRKGMYFTYCGGNHRRNRIYLDVDTGYIQE